VSTKGSKRGKKKGGSLKRASLFPLQTKEELVTTPGGKTRNWAALKQRYLDYEFLTYTQMAKDTGIPENVIGKKACVQKGQPETWKDERSRKSLELIEAQHEARKKMAGALNAKLRAEIQANADLLEAVGQQSLVRQGPTGTEVVPVSAGEAIRAMDAAGRMKQALVEEERQKAAQGPNISQGADTDGQGDQSGVVILPLKQAAELWQQQNKK